VKGRRKERGKERNGKGGEGNGKEGGDTTYFINAIPWTPPFHRRTGYSLQIKIYCAATTLLHSLPPSTHPTLPPFLPLLFRTLHVDTNGLPPMGLVEEVSQKLKQFAGIVYVCTFWLQERYKFRTIRLIILDRYVSRLELSDMFGGWLSPLAHNWRRH